MYTNHDPIKQEVGFIFVWSGSELWIRFQYSKLKLKNKNLWRLLSFSRPIHWYHSHADPIWTDGTFNDDAVFCLLIYYFFLSLWPFSSVGLTKFFVGIAGLTYFLRQQVLIYITGRRSFQGKVTSFMDFYKSQTQNAHKIKLVLAVYAPLIFKTLIVLMAEEKYKILFILWKPFLILQSVLKSASASDSFWK